MRKILMQKTVQMRQSHLQKKTLRNASNFDAKNNAKFAENNMAIFYIFQAFS